MAKYQIMAGAPDGSGSFTTVETFDAADPGALMARVAVLQQKNNVAYMTAPVPVVAATVNATAPASGSASATATVTTSASTPKAS